MHRHRPRRHPRRLGAALTAALAAFLVIGCSTDTTSSSSPRASGPDASGPTAIPTDPDATPDGSLPTQTDTEWGRIWDALPPSFPAYPGASPTETGAGPASAILDVGDADPGAVATFYQSALEGAGLSTISLSGPREDGSLELESAGEGECQVRTTITPLGGTTIVEILYGSGCPFD
jgi:hypothetical protein